MYDVIVLGATFAAAGIAQTLKKNCLILEQCLQAGCEFFGALNFGSDYESSPESEEAKALYQGFKDTNIYSCDKLIYSHLSEADVLFGTRLVKAERTEKGFSCVTYGVDGFCTYEAKRVIDTRSCDEISASKTFNMLIESDEKPEFSGVESLKTGVENHYVLRVPVPLSCGYSEARIKARTVIHSFSENQRLILLASLFDYQIKKDYEKHCDGIIHLPSKAYKNPILAFEAGVKEATR